jgi:hypothetical protein
LSRARWGIVRRLHKGTEVLDWQDVKDQLLPAAR